MKIQKNGKHFYLISYSSHRRCSTLDVSSDIPKRTAATAMRLRNTDICAQYKLPEKRVKAWSCQETVKIVNLQKLLRFFFFYFNRQKQICMYVIYNRRYKQNNVSFTDPNHFKTNYLYIVQELYCFNRINYKILHIF